MTVLIECDRRLLFRWRGRRIWFWSPIIGSPQRLVVQRFISASDSGESRFDALPQFSLTLVKTVRVKAPRQHMISALDFFNISKPANIKNFVVILRIINAGEERIQFAGFVISFARALTRFSRHLGAGLRLGSLCAFNKQRLRPVAAIQQACK